MGSRAGAQFRSAGEVQVHLEEMAQLTPKIVWAERKDVLLVTVSIQDAKDVNIDLKEDRFVFTAVSEDKHYHADIELLKGIKPADSTNRVTPRQVELKLKKVEEGMWGKLQKGRKTPMIEIDWSRWVDEDQADEDFGGFGGGGDMFGDFGAGGMDDMDREGDSDDEEEMPGLEAGAAAEGEAPPSGDAPAADAPAEAPKEEA
eukprot:NODE_1181_length_964_cov_885.743169_g983_i0.p1 GENE.NODE_1181_length_964_cov_885.743169_g983_i0~~NODE_1181_length_964_cov_885.743169_g983_i0.p1  ORF type:complete len:202 (+),score=57.29 NODE_1181_length_964_cov_885.743169_g983_i0:28-633(+)